MGSNNALLPLKNSWNATIAQKAQGVISYQEFVDRRSQAIREIFGALDVPVSGNGIPDEMISTIHDYVVQNRLEAAISLFINNNSNPVVQAEIFCLEGRLAAIKSDMISGIDQVDVINSENEVNQRQYLETA